MHERRAGRDLAFANAMERLDVLLMRRLYGDKPLMAAALAPLPAIVMVSGTPFRRIAFFKNRSAAIVSRASNENL